MEKIFKEVGLIIIDEFHYAKNLEAQRTRYLHEYISKYKPERVIGLTGTAIKNRIPEML